MSWKEENAIKRIFNTFKRLSKNIFNEDIEALKLLNETIQTQNAKIVNDNLLYAKLLSISLIQNLRFYKSMEIAKKAISDDLIQPLDYHLQMLTIELNNQELNSYFDSLGLKDWKTSSEMKENENIISKNQKEIIERLGKSWSDEVVLKSFYNTANEILKKVEFYT